MVPVSISASHGAGLLAGPSGHSAGGRRDGDTATVFPGTSHQTFCVSLENPSLMARILSLVSDTQVIWIFLCNQLEEY